ncbi:ferrochelatase [Hyphococcus sp.]|uniref:ferrochelatase n=1 Tax=Hyphococcus sp. TaxID=2038636 RepID=UPI002088E78F|nr:MAG: ferrochelatase [Marinicaulis sp.]
MNDSDVTVSGALSERSSRHPIIPESKIGVLLVNLGTPEASDAGAVRRYLREFLSDKRIVDLPRALWLPILYGVILNIRPAATARNYAKIWRKESNESPLRYFTRRQSDLLGEKLDGAVVDWAMRYGNPSVASRLEAMKQDGCERILVIPLYPQYSATTTASVADAVFAAVKTMRWQPAIRMAPAFHDEAKYIEALAGVARRHLATQSTQPERVVISFHGLPQRYFDAGDPYYCHCAKTARLLHTEMGWTEDFAPLTFQSKFGREKWLEPSTEETIKRLAGDGVKSLAVIMPGFVSDCIETLEEIDIAARQTFMAAGGETFTSIPCLNDAPEMEILLEHLARRETAGWTSD